MARIVGINEAHEITGLSKHELRTGSISGKYPHLRVGDAKRGKIVFDIELLEKHIKRLMEESTIRKEENVTTYGKLRKIML